MSSSRLNGIRETIIRRETLLRDNLGLSLLTAYLATRNKPNAVFIWIPKNAGTSLYNALRAPKLKSLHRVRTRFPGRGIVTFGHMDYRALVEAGYVSRKFDKSAFTFAFSRNPYHRAVSLFFYLRARDLVSPEETFLAFCRRLRDKGCEPIGLYNRRGLSICNPQVRWIERVAIDYLGRYESLESDSRKIMQHLGLPATTLPKINVGRRFDYDNYYCDETRQLVESFYEEDFRSLGYPGVGEQKNTSAGGNW